MRRRHFLAFAATFISATYAQAFDSFQELRVRLLQVTKSVFFPGEPRFDQLKKLVNPALVLEDPDAIIRVANSKEIGHAIQLCEEKQLNVRIRSGGHSFEGFSMGRGVVFDVRDLKVFEIEPHSVRAGAGLTLSELQSNLAKQGYGFPVGSCPTVGLAGFLLGGGHSLKSRMWGLGADRVQSLRVVLASGERIVASPKSNGDLYWAMLGGGGGNFAVVEEFRLDLIRAHRELVFDFSFPASSATSVFTFWEEWSHRQPAYASVVLILAGQSQKIISLRIHGVIGDVNADAVDTESIFSKTIWVQLRQLAPTAEKQSFRSSSSMREPGIVIPFKGSSQYAELPIGQKGFSEIVKSIEALPNPSPFTMVFEPLGGCILNPLRKNSYPHRNLLYIVELYTGWLEASAADAHRQNINQLHRAVEALFSGRSYVNYCDFDLPGDWARRYYGESLNDLLEVKRRYDPGNCFDFGNHSLSHYLRDTRLLPRK